MSPLPFRLQLLLAWRPVTPASGLSRNDIVELGSRLIGFAVKLAGVPLEATTFIAWPRREFLSR